MDKPLAPACKVYHAHCKEVKDWAVFAGNVVTSSGLSISVCYCCECGMQEGVAALQGCRPGGAGIQTVRGNPVEGTSTVFSDWFPACCGLCLVCAFGFMFLDARYNICVNDPEGYKRERRPFIL